MFLQLRYGLKQLGRAMFEKQSNTPLGRWKLKDYHLYSHFGNIDNDIGVKYYPLQ